MSNFIVHQMDTPWTSSNPGLLLVTSDNQVFVGDGSASNLIVAQAGALNVFAEYLPASPLDLTAFDELRFWIRANHAAEGTISQPFYLEFSYTDTNDNPGETHRWLVPINRADAWEQRRIGIENERRGSIDRLRFTCLTNDPFVCHIDELLAVHEEMLLDLEQALAARLDGVLRLPGLSDIGLAQAAAAGDTQVIVPLNRGFDKGNRIIIRGGAAGDEIHDVIGLTHDTGTNRTTLQFAAGDALVGALPMATTKVSVLVPLIVEDPPAPTVAPGPAIIATMMDTREDLERTVYFTQRDSFRLRGALTVCSTRPAPRAYFVDYQLTAVAPRRSLQVLTQTFLLERLSVSRSLRINGVESPVSMQPPPEIHHRDLGQPGPVYVRLGTRMETAVRVEQPWVRQSFIVAAQPEAPLDQEGIVIVL
ncbi:MAG TPA: hypothetical protein VKA60_13215 [Blastocatellia bacterium]|nr:hypothetical protein [Blastocatellia bacterium]